MQKKIENEIIRKVKKLPLLTPSYSKNSWKNYLEAGCYNYALNLFINKKLFIGDLIGCRCTNQVANEELIQILWEEMDFLKWEMEKVDLNTSMLSNQKMIYLQREENTGYYHFLRRDKEGWSHKSPKELPKQAEIAELIQGKKENCEGWCFLLTKKAV